MPLRSAALSVATVATAPFFVYFMLVDGGRMAPEAITLALVAGGMVMGNNRSGQPAARH